MIVSITPFPVYVFRVRFAKPLKHESFGGDVASLLDHVLSNGASGREGLAVTGPSTITCTQSALADQAGCSKTEANRQLWRMEREGQVTLTTTQRGTRIEVRSTPLACCIAPGCSYPERWPERWPERGNKDRSELRSKFFINDGSGRAQ
jgi:hypothetical protein